MMDNLIDRYTDWCLSLDPDWVGFAMFMFACVFVGTVGLFLFVLLFIVTQGNSLLVIPAFILYVLYLAFFKQGG